MAKMCAKGAIFAYESSASPSTFSTLPGVGDFDMPLVGERDEIDVTSHDSTGDYEETVLGVIRTPTITVPINGWDGSNTHHAAMVTRAQANTLTNFKVTMKDGMMATFAGYVKGVTPSNPVNGALNATITVKPTGAITYATAA